MKIRQFIGGKLSGLRCENQVTNSFWDFRSFLKTDVNLSRSVVQPNFFCQFGKSSWKFGRSQKLIYGALEVGIGQYGSATNFLTIHNHSGNMVKSIFFFGDEFLHETLSFKYSSIPT